MHHAALRRIAAEIACVRGNRKRFAAQGAEHEAWREKVDATPLDLPTAEAVQQWKLRYLGRHKDLPEEHSRAVNTVNAHISKARSLATTKALESAAGRLALPDPLPFAEGKPERIRVTSQYYADKKARVTTGLDALLT